MATGPAEKPTRKKNEVISDKKQKTARKKEEEAFLVPPATLCVQCKKELCDPHLLCCMHSVCRECLLAVKQQDGRLQCPKCSNNATCAIVDPPRGRKTCEAVRSQCVPVRNGPLCRYIEGRKIIQLVRRGSPTVVCGNPSCKTSAAEAVAFCVDCWKFFCSVCLDGHQLMSDLTGNHTVKSIEELVSADLDQMSDAAAMLMKKAVPHSCPQHCGEVLKWHCEGCDILMCHACALDKGPHCPKYLDLSLSQRHRQSLKLSQQVVGAARKVYQKGKEVLETQSNAVDRSREKALEDAHRLFERAHTAIAQREEEVCEEITAACNQKKDLISERAKSCSDEEDALSTAHTALSLLRAQGSNHEVISIQSVVQAKALATTVKVREEQLHPHVSPVVCIVPLNEQALLSAIKEFGHVQRGASPKECTLAGVTERLDPKPVSFTLTTLDSSRVACSGGGERVQVFLRPAQPLPGVAIRAEVEDSGGGQYQVVFRVVYTGKCELSVLVNGDHIKGSPFTVGFEDEPAVFLQGQWVSNKSTEEIQELQASKGVLNLPQQHNCTYGVAVSPNGTCFVSDYSSHLIDVFDAERNHVRTFGQHGTGASQLSSPYGLATTADGLLFVTNYGNHCVDVFRENGTFIRRIGQGQLSHPIDVTVHANGQVYVADCGNHRVTVLTQDGQLVRTFGSEGSGAGQFSNPCGIAVSPDGQVYVSDYKNNRVQVFTADGTYIRAFGQGQLKRPRGLTFTTQGNVVVASYGNRCVSIFNLEGQLVHTLNVGSNPYTVCFDQNGDLLVAEHTQVDIF